MVWGSFPFYTEDEIRFDEVNLDFGITPECKDIIRKCLKKCPNERPSLLQLFDTPFIKQTKLNEGSEDLTNASPNSFSDSNLSSENLTNASNLGTSAKDNSFSDSNLTRSEDLNNVSNKEISASPNSFRDSNLTHSLPCHKQAQANQVQPSASACIQPCYAQEPLGSVATRPLGSGLSGTGPSSGPGLSALGLLGPKPSEHPLSSVAARPSGSGNSGSGPSSGLGPSGLGLSGSGLSGPGPSRSGLQPAPQANLVNLNVSKSSESVPIDNGSDDVEEEYLNDEPQSLRPYHKPADNYSKQKFVTANWIKVNIAAGEKRKCETTQIQNDFDLDANTDTTIKRKKQESHQSFENQTDAVEAAFMFHEKESRKGQKITKKEKKRSRSR